MKSLIRLLYLCGSLFAASFAAGASPQKDFFEAVNNGWKNRNYAAIETAINNRLAVNANDILALSVKPYYLVYVAGNIADAKSAVDAFWASVDATTSNLTLRNAARKLMEGIKDMDNANGGALSTDEENTLHNLFPSGFPMLGSCLHYTAMLEGSQ